MRAIWVRALTFSFCLAAAASTGFAQPPSESQAIRGELDRLRQEFDAVRQQFADRLSLLEGRLATVEGRPSQPTVPLGQTPTTTDRASVPEGAAGAGGPQGSLPIYGNVNVLSKIFNPDLAVIGNFQAVAGTNSVESSPAFEMREVETSFQAVVDPYARADFFVAFGAEGVELEEGYMTFPTLSGGFLMKAGKLRSTFGKVNVLHNHVLPWSYIAVHEPDGMRFTERIAHLHE